MIVRIEEFVEWEAPPPQPVKNQTEKRITTEFETCLQDIRFSGPGSERMGKFREG
jgi:hypothetical protein